MPQHARIDTTIRIEFKSKVLQTSPTPIPTPIGQTWIEFLNRTSIPFIPEQHVLLTSKRKPIEPNSLISAFYETTRNRDKYVIHIENRPRRARGRPRRTAQVPLTTFANGNDLNLHFSGRQAERNLNNWNQPGNVENPIAPTGPSTDLNAEDDTQAGNILRPEEANIHASVTQYITGHCSNRDLLTIRTELQSLKNADNWRQLRRLLPTTSAVLNEAFFETHL